MANSYTYDSGIVASLADEYMVESDVIKGMTTYEISDIFMVGYMAVGQVKDRMACEHVKFSPLGLSVRIVKNVIICDLYSVQRCNLGKNKLFHRY